MKFAQKLQEKMRKMQSEQPDQQMNPQKQPIQGSGKETSNIHDTSGGEMPDVNQVEEDIENAEKNFKKAG